MAGALVYTVLNPQKSFASMPVIDETSILVHNGQSHRFQQAANDFFGVSVIQLNLLQNWTISEAKSLFEQGLSDTNNLEQCRTSTNTELEIPETYDWRVQFPECVRESAPKIEKECASTYVATSLSAVEDRICMGSKQIVKLSVDEVLECD